MKRRDSDATRSAETEGLGSLRTGKRGPERHRPKEVYLMGDDVIGRVEDGAWYALALEAAERLEQRGRIAESMVCAVPDIVACERQEQASRIYETEARQWFRLASAVRTAIAKAEALDRLSPDLEK